MHILLVYPEVPATFWAMKHTLKVIGKKALFPPLGLLTVAAMLPARWQKRLVDLNVKPMTEEDLMWADYVFLSAMNVQETSVRQIIARCQEAGVKIVAGGPLFTNEHERFGEVDHLVLNEAEITLPHFLADLDKGSPKPVYTSEDFADVLQTPLPQWELIDDIGEYQYAIVQYSRGCPYYCDFCDVVSLFGRVPRVKSPEQIIAELDLLVNKFDSLFFADDNLIGNRKHLKTQLLPALIEWRKQKQPTWSFATQLTINLADDQELMDLMLDAGFRDFFIGIETPEVDSLTASRKHQNTKRDLLENVSRLHKAGFVIQSGFVLGFDTDTPDIFQRQIDFIQESGIVMAFPQLLKAPPGTDLYKRMKQEGRLLERFSFDETKTNFIPKMDPEVLYSGLKTVLQNVFSPEYVYLRTKKFLQEYEPPKVVIRTHDNNILKHLGTILRSIFMIGVIDKERSYFWKLLLWASLKRPKLIYYAFMNGILMYQLRNLYETYYSDSDDSDADLVIHEAAERDLSMVEMNIEA